jgi:phytol kinase
MHFFTDETLGELPIALLIAGVVLTGLWISNIIYDRGVPQYISRKIGHCAGGVGFLICLFFTSSGWPIILSAAFGAVLLGARLTKPDTFRGVGGSGRSSGVMAEVWFPWVAVPVFIVSWSWLDRPALGVAVLLFMAWGDGVTGLVRSQVYHQPVKGLWGSVVMLGVCLVVSLVLVRPFWIGSLVSLVAVIVEWAFGDTGKFKWADDNWAIPVVSLAVLLGLMAMIGNL